MTPIVDCSVQRHGANTAPPYNAAALANVPFVQAHGQERALRLLDRFDTAAEQLESNLL